MQLGKNILNKLKLMFSQRSFSIDFDFSYLEHHISICFDVFYCINTTSLNIDFINLKEGTSIKQPTLKLSKFNGPHSLPIPEHNLTLKTKQNKQEQKRNAILAQTLLISTEIH